MNALESILEMTIQRGGIENARKHIEKTLDSEAAARFLKLIKPHARKISSAVKKAKAKKHNDAKLRRNALQRERRRLQAYRKKNPPPKSSLRTDGATPVPSLEDLPESKQAVEREGVPHLISGGGTRLTSSLFQNQHDHLPWKS
jgi:hypothetical protein